MITHIVYFNFNITYLVVKHPVVQKLWILGSTDSQILSNDFRNLLLKDIFPPKTDERYFVNIIDIEFASQNVDKFGHIALIRLPLVYVAI